MAYPRSIRPDYSTGTITLVSGSKNFTTAGSSLESANVFAGDLIMSPTGLVLVIDEVTGQNSGTLMEPCPAMAAGSGIPVRIRFQPDGSRFQAAYRELAMAQTGGNLAAFADLVGAMDMVPVFIGPGAIALVAKSEFGPTDTHGNLAQLAGLAKQNNQFIVMGADGSLGLRPLSDLDEKFKLPSGGSATQLIDGTGALTTKVGLPISTATQAALDLKASTTLVNTKSAYNWIINGNFTINQRGGVKKPANGVYGFDRWKGHSNGIEQIVESLPAGEYTLTWTGGGVGSFGGTSGASPIVATVTGGNTSVVVPQAATKVSLISGNSSSKDPWTSCDRSKTIEENLCMRYYEKGNYKLIIVGWQTIIVFQYPFKVMKRSQPTTSVTVNYKPPGSADPYIELSSVESFSVRQPLPNGSTIDFDISWTADSEL